jgi:hypothetical protein
VTLSIKYLLILSLTVDGQIMGFFSRLNPVKTRKAEELLLIFKMSVGVAELAIRHEADYFAGIEIGPYVSAEKLIIKYADYLSQKIQDDAFDRAEKLHSINLSVYLSGVCSGLLSEVESKLGRSPRGSELFLLLKEIIEAVIPDIDRAMNDGLYIVSRKRIESDAMQKLRRMNDEHVRFQMLQRAQQAK